MAVARRQIDGDCHAAIFRSENLTQRHREHGDSQTLKSQGYEIRSARTDRKRVTSAGNAGRNASLEDGGNASDRVVAPLCSRRSSGRVRRGGGQRVQLVSLCLCGR